MLIEAVGRCPPEDVGRACGDAKFLAALANLEHNRHAELRGRHGESFDLQ